MSTISIYRAEFLTFSSHGSRPRLKFQRTSLSPTMKMDSKSMERVKKEELSIQLQTPSIPQLENSRPSNLRFDRLQPSDQELNQDNRLEFGKFVAREAVLDEEFWTAAWLRAESHWEDRLGERYVDNFKRKFAEQEFNAIKGRYKGQQGQTYACVVTEREKHLFCSINRTHMNKYIYVSNLCVAKSARRQGIARNMLNFAFESARSSGVELVYVHVNRNNGPALELYQNIGFEMVEIASSQLSKQQMYLLCYKT
ncbi:uncharacterized protein LOC111284538 isoform X2 [Durio zibethinus]|uniref:Uncharacterized protein LOC111284538 isoform X2 n=1 Tax=Durio zibethinus TaxID=66656 RepID=A0A6P5XM42_DURZI|nr:uncharacterized protein LOC111284538 isoform X2 [Durio zibethinus]